MYDQEVDRRCTYYRSQQNRRKQESFMIRFFPVRELLLCGKFPIPEYVALVEYGLGEKPEISAS